MMTFRQFLAYAIEEAKVEVIRDYLGQGPHLEGALSALKLCLDKSPPELAKILRRAFFAKQGAFHATTLNRYWRICSFFNEVEWICQLVSVVLINQEVDPILQPTMRAALAAQRISKSHLLDN